MKHRLGPIIIFICVALTFLPNTYAEYYFYTPLYGHSDYVYCIAFSPDGSVLASGSADNTIRIWDTSIDKTKKILIGHTRRVNALAFHGSSENNGLLLASGGEDRTVRIWDPVTGNTKKTINTNAGPVYSIAFSPNGKSLANGNSDGSIQLWDYNIGNNVKTLYRT